MPVRKANAVWYGNLIDGNGKLGSETGAVSGQYSFKSRFEEGTGTNPEELVAAAHSGCFSMAFANTLAKAGFNPKSVKTEDKVHFEKVGDGFSITKIEMSTDAEVPGIDEQTFLKLAEDAKKNCPISRALSEKIELVLNAKLV